MERIFKQKNYFVELKECSDYEVENWNIKKLLQVIKKVNFENENIFVFSTGGNTPAFAIYIKGLLTTIIVEDLSLEKD